MNEKQAFRLADHMVMSNRELFQPKMTSKQYVKQREELIKLFMGDEK